MSLTDRDRKILLLLLPVVVILAYWFLVLSPKRHEAKPSPTQVTEAQQARDTAKQQAQQLARAKAQFPTQYAQMVRLGKALPTRVDMPSLLVQLSAAAAGTHIKFGAITVGDRAVAPPSRRSRCPARAARHSLRRRRPEGQGRQRRRVRLGRRSATASNSAGTTGASGASSDARRRTPHAPGLDEVPLTFKFGGQFFDLADFFHQLKRFVRVTNAGSPSRAA